MAIYFFKFLLKAKDPFFIILLCYSFFIYLFILLNQFWNLFETLSENSSKR